jgi:hypothetical protein
LIESDRKYGAPIVLSHMIGFVPQIDHERERTQ